MIPAHVLLSAYCQGLFPMARSRDGSLDWYTADPRGIIDLDAFHVPKRVLQVVRSGKFECRVDSAFEQVIRACAERVDTWISDTIVQSYVNLHRLGFAHSVESWREGELVGGLYGVALRGAFFGESMFHRVTHASKVALVHLVERLRARGYRLLDTQTITPVMAQFGARSIAIDEYMARLSGALEVECEFG